MWEYSGGYPFLLQQLISTKIDARREGVLGDEALVRRALLEFTRTYQTMVSVSLDKLRIKLEAKLMPLMETLQILCGSGLVREAKPEQYEINTVLFRRWTQNQ